MTAREIHPYSFGGDGVKNLGPVVLPASAPDLPDLEPPVEDLEKIESGADDGGPVAIDEPVVDDQPEPAETTEPESKAKSGKVPPA